MSTARRQARWSPSFTLTVPAGTSRYDVATATDRLDVERRAVPTACSSQSGSRGSANKRKGPWSRGAAHADAPFERRLRGVSDQPGYAGRLWFQPSYRLRSRAADHRRPDHRLPELRSGGRRKFEEPTLRLPRHRRGENVRYRRRGDGVRLFRGCGARLTRSSRPVGGRGSGSRWRGSAALVSVSTIKAARRRTSKRWCVPFTGRSSWLSTMLHQGQPSASRSAEYRCRCPGRKPRRELERPRSRSGSRLDETVINGVVDRLFRRVRWRNAECPPFPRAGCRGWRSSCQPGVAGRSRSHGLPSARVGSPSGRQYANHCASARIS